MKTHRVLLFVMLSVLCGVNAQGNVFTGTEGQSVTITCHLSFSGSRRSFCRGECSKNNILIETTADKDHNDKYIIEYYGSWMSSGSVIVTIRQLTKSDEGHYRCSMSSLLSAVFMDVVLVVKDATTTSSTQSTPSVTFTEATEGFFFHLVLCAAFICAIVLLLPVVLLILYRLISKRNVDGLNTGGDLDGKNTELCPYEIYSPPFTRENSIYQNLDPANRDQDQIYSTLTHTQNI